MTRSLAALENDLFYAYLHVAHVTEEYNAAVRRLASPPPLPQCDDIVTADIVDQDNTCMWYAAVKKTSTFYRRCTNVSALQSRGKRFCQAHACRTCGIHKASNGHAQCNGCLAALTKTKDKQRRHDE